MKRTPFLIFGLILSLFLWQGCGGTAKDKNKITIESDENGAKSDITIESDKLEASAQEALQKLSDGELKAGEVVSYQSLKELMPDDLLGMKRTKLEGQKSGMQGMNIATATAEYREEDKKIKVAIIDVGGSSIALAGLAMWANMEFERDSDEGYERTTKIDGHKAFEQYDKNKQSGQVSVLLENRFILNVEGDHISEKELRKALDDIGLRKLSNLK